MNPTLLDVSTYIPPLNVFSRYDVETTLCLWEAMLEHHADWIPTLGGAWAARSLMIDITPYCGAAWDEDEHNDITHRYDSFDWDFVPRWLASLLDRAHADNGSYQIIDLAKNHRIPA